MFIIFDSRRSNVTAKRQRYPSAERLNGFVEEPTVERTENGEEVYRFRGVAVETINSKKGLGVVATEPLGRGFLIPFGGKRAPDTHLINYWQKKPQCRPADRSIAYIIKSYSSDKAKQYDCYLDANPELYPSKCPKYAWIGSLVNAADSFKSVNCKLVYRPDWSLTRRDYRYPHCLNKHFVETTRVINPGEELVTDYEYGAKIESKQGFGPTLTKPKKMPMSKQKWEALRQLRRNIAATKLNDPNNLAKRRPKRLKVRRSKMTPW